MTSERMATYRTRASDDVIAREETRPVVHIEDGLAWLHEELERSQLAVDELRKRLEPIIRREDINPGGTPGKIAPESASDLSERIHTAAARVAGLNYQLIRILERLDLG